MSQSIEDSVLHEILRKHSMAFREKILHLFEHKGFEYAASGAHLDFRILLPSDNAFFKSASKKKLIGIAIRDKLINPTLKDLFIAHWGIDPSFDCSYGPYPAFADNNFWEKSYPFEFIVPTNQGNIGYRYTTIPADSETVREWFVKYDLSYIRSLDWDREGNDYMGLSYKNLEMADRLKDIPIIDFFTTYFTEKEYEECIKSFREDVSFAWDYIDYSTVPELTPRYLHDFKKDIATRLSSAHIDGLHYSYIENGTDVQISDLLSESVIQTIQSRCIADELYRCLIGKTDFAKCFLTAEYLFSIFTNGNNLIEYTSVVCGYLKCFEQFMYLIIDSMLDSGLYNNSYIHIKGGFSTEERDNKIVIQNPYFIKNPSSKKNKPEYLIQFRSIYKTRFDTSLAAMVNFLADNEMAWICPTARVSICRLMRNYVKYCRNEYFHKDNIKLFNVAKSIRNNSICILLLLLGNLKIPTTVKPLQGLLGIYDDSFDRLVWKLKEVFPHYFEFILKYGDEVIKAYRLFDQPLLEYNNEFGTLENNSIHFLRVDGFDNIPWPDDKQFQAWANDKQELIIKKGDILPDQIWVLMHGKEHEIIW